MENKPPIMVCIFLGRVESSEMSVKQGSELHSWSNLVKACPGYC